MRLRSGMILFALALSTTASVGLVSEMSGDHPAEARERALDDTLLAEHRALGWRTPAEPSARQAADRLRQVTGVELLVAVRGFELPLGHGALACDAPAEAPARAAAALVARELSRLPASFLHAVRLRRVLLCGGLTENRAPIPSLPNYQGTLLLDVAGAPEYLMRLLYHEVFHFADLADDDSVLHDPSWAALNPPGFRYGGGGRTMREPSAGAIGGAPPGFATRYGTSALEEDKAEVFALLCAAPAELEARLAGDPVLAAKVARVRELTAALAPEMDERFWRAR